MGLDQPQRRTRRSLPGQERSIVAARKAGGRSWLVRSAWAGALLISMLIAAPDAGNAETFVVNSTGDASDDDTGDGVCETGAMVSDGMGGMVAECTLRAAIEQANVFVGMDVSDAIFFGIPGAGPHTLQPGSALPTITDFLGIFGDTQPGASCETWPPTLLIELDGSNSAAPTGSSTWAGRATCTVSSSIGS